MNIAAIFAVLLIIFLIIWMSLSFTNQLCDSVGLCYKKECPACAMAPSPMAPSPMAPSPMAPSPMAPSPMAPSPGAM